MKWFVRLLAILITIFPVTALYSPVQAADGGSCSADPVAGPPGTTFSISCTGFTANTYVNAYVVEPDGRAVSAGQIVGFTSNVGNGSILTNKDGAASFVWQSQGGTVPLSGGGAFAHQFGAWTWVVHQLGAAQSILHSAQARVTLTAVQAEQVGATLQAASVDGETYNFSGSGFWRDEYVNVWVSLPPTCSGNANVEAASADDPYYQGVLDGFFGPSSVKANEQGSIAFSILFTSRACRGEYQTTVYAPGSTYGAIASYAVGGNAIRASAGRAITAAPAAVDALNPVLTILGSKWNASQAVNCWSTRPDGRSMNVGSITADTSGNFALDIHISGFDSYVPYASEEPGVWSLTCRAPDNGEIAITTVTVHALTSDP